MNTLFIDSRMGITGIKLLGALAELMENPEIIVKKFNELGVEGIRMERHIHAAGGMMGAQIKFIRFDANDDEYADELDEEDDNDKKKFHRSLHQHHIRTIRDVTEIIDDLPLNGRVRKKAVEIFNVIVDAAAKAKGIAPESVKLRRTGSRAVIASVIGVCMAFDELEYDKIIASPITTGTGYTETSRGNVPIPIPSLQNILGDIPYSNGNEQGEICTLEGAAILKVYADAFGEMPELTVIKTGVGFGRRSFSKGVNCTRAVYGKEIRCAANAAITELEAVLYNDNAQSLLLASERLEEAGVIDAYTMPIASLKGGRGFILKCICPNECADKAAGEILRNTSAVRVRRIAAAAYETASTARTVDTPIGTITVIKTEGFGVMESRALASDIAAAARKNDISYNEAYEIVMKEL